MKLTPKSKIITGYKATDKDMKCRDFQFELGKWYKHDGDLIICESGFHFCEYPSGPWCYYGPNSRLFKVEARSVLLSSGPGADLKHVAKEIKLVEEINAIGDRNTGHNNTGHGNTGHNNTGYNNAGDNNTGYRNTGDNNTGDWNTGDWNTGDSNTGYRNTGDRSTGAGNVGNYHSGCLNCADALFYIFDKPANRDDVDFNLVCKLAALLHDDTDIDPTQFLSLPNATKTTIKNLHYAHKKARKEKS